MKTGCSSVYCCTRHQTSMRRAAGRRAGAGGGKTTEEGPLAGDMAGRRGVFAGRFRGDAFHHPEGGTMHHTSGQAMYQTGPTAVAQYQPVGQQHAPEQGAERAQQRRRQNEQLARPRRIGQSSNPEIVGGRVAPANTPLKHAPARDAPGANRWAISPRTVTKCRYRSEVEAGAGVAPPRKNE